MRIKTVVAALVAAFVFVGFVSAGIVVGFDAAREQQQDQAASARVKAVADAVALRAVEYMTPVVEADVYRVQNNKQMPVTTITGTPDDLFTESGGLSLGAIVQAGCAAWVDGSSDPVPIGPMPTCVGWRRVGVADWQMSQDDLSAATQEAQSMVRALLGDAYDVRLTQSAGDVTAAIQGPDGAILATSKAAAVMPSSALDRHGWTPADGS